MAVVKTLVKRFYKNRLFQKEAKGVHFAYQKQPKEAWEVAKAPLFNHNMTLSH
jgi:hypothetical protein